ncbi:hypothetical protein Hdeb2414_s0005g00180821 [Helianthus debilis subsp. tardiflorus]
MDVSSPEAVTKYKSAVKIVYMDLVIYIEDMALEAFEGVELFIQTRAMMTVKHYGRGSGSGATTLGKPFVHPATVDLRDKVYELLRQNATRFLLDDVYRNPGPLQFDGPGADSKAVKAFVGNNNQTFVRHVKETNFTCVKRWSRVIHKPLVQVVPNMYNS